MEKKSNDLYFAKGTISILGEPKLNAFSVKDVTGITRHLYRIRLHVLTANGTLAFLFKILYHLILLL